jgi:phosphonate metabolism protein PhnN/1,5-bisphosphokinase (PRPP-forming)
MSADNVAGGLLFLVVGPSGAGKDALISAARDRLADDPGVLFPLREITRPAGSGGENHREVTISGFEKAVGEGRYALHWRAHGLCYGIPSEIVPALESGRNVVVNASRTVLDTARQRFPGTRILSITADPAVLEARLNARARSSDGDLQQRLKRASLPVSMGPDVTVIDNSGDLAVALKAFLVAIGRAS